MNTLSRSLVGWTVATLSSTLKCVHVKAGKNATIPHGFSISHSVLIEPKNGNPYFTVLLTDEKKESPKPPVGFKK